MKKVTITKTITAAVQVHKELKKAEVEGIFTMPGVTFEVKRRTVHATKEVSSYSEKWNVEDQSKEWAFEVEVEAYVLETMENIYLEKCYAMEAEHERKALAILEEEEKKEKEEKEKTGESKMVENIIINDDSVVDMDDVVVDMKEENNDTKQEKVMQNSTEQKVMEVLTLGRTFTISEDKDYIKTLQIVTFEDLNNSSFGEKDMLTKMIMQNPQFISVGRKFLSIMNYPKETPINEEMTCVRERVKWKVAGYTGKNLEFVFMVEREYKITAPITKKSYILTDNRAKVKNKNIDEYFLSKNKTKMIGDFYIVKGKSRIELVEIITYHDIISKIGEDELLYNRLKKESLDLGILSDNREKMVDSHVNALLYYGIFEKIFIPILEEQEDLIFKEYIENKKNVRSNYDNLTSDNAKVKVFFITRELKKYDDKDGDILFKNSRFEDF